MLTELVVTYFRKWSKSMYFETLLQGQVRERSFKGGEWHVTEPVVATGLAYSGTLMFGCWVDRARDQYAVDLLFGTAESRYPGVPKPAGYSLILAYRAYRLLDERDEIDDYTRVYKSDTLEHIWRFVADREYRRNSPAP